jgi:hypothetical protein
MANHRGRFGVIVSFLLLLAGLRHPAAAAAQGTAPPAGGAMSSASASVTRSVDGTITVHAIHLSSPLRVDGRLDEEIYQRVPAISDFIQTVPQEGEPASERTEAWVAYDDSYIYVSGRCWDSAPPESWTANEMRRDTNQLRQNDMFGVLLDTFHDRRNGYNFYTNPLGARADQAITDEGNPNVDWNPVWEVRTGRFEGGWTAELAIPFKSIRYRSGADQTWGIQLRRSIRRKNEWTHLTFVPASTGGTQGIFRVSAAATLVGLDLPSASRNIEIKPYGISRLTTDRLQSPAIANHLDADFGVDAKVGITANLTADISYNTDFAQVEVDEQQVNLTRFVLSFPEKREFFLEGRGIFDFGRGGSSPGGGGGGGAGGLTPTLFYSRRIGLNRNRVIPIDLGGRVTGKIGDFGVGVMNIQAADESASETPATNFTVVRVKRDILRRSSVGALFTNRSVSAVGPGGNQAYGADAAFSFFENVNLGAYYARTSTPTLEGDDDSYMGRFEYAHDRYGARAEYLKVGDNFNPEVGLVRRDDFARSFAAARYSPRPASIEAVRKFTWEASLEYLENGAGQLETRQLVGSFTTEFETSDQFSVDATNNYELLVDRFDIAEDVAIPVGSYDFSDITVRYAFGQQRRVSGTVSLQRGGFFDGTITAVGYSGGRVSILKQLSVEPSVSINRVELPHGSFTTQVTRARTDYAFSPRMFASGLVQYASAERAFSTNLRFRWEYLPGSELFVVYTDERDTLRRGFPGLENRAFVVKMNRLLQF